MCNENTEVLPLKSCIEAYLTLPLLYILITQFVLESYTFCLYNQPSITGSALMNRQMPQNKRRQKYKSTRNLCVYAMLTCALVLTGCAQQFSAPLVVKVQDSILYVSTGHPTVEQSRGIGMADMMEVAEDVLARMHFTIEKADVLHKESQGQSGFIRTRPLPGAQFFEFWRSDNVGADNTLAANLHTIRRTVTLDISQQDEQLRIGCEVQAQRLSLPENQVSSSARVYGMFSRSSPSLQRLKLNPEQKRLMAWINLGGDSRLEAEILKRIKTQILQRTSHRLQTMENQT